MFQFIYFNGFLTTADKEFCCPSSISEVIKRKIVHFVHKVSDFIQNVFCINVLNLMVVSKISTHPDDVIKMPFGSKRPKNKSYQILTLVSRER